MVESLKARWRRGSRNIAQENICPAFVFWVNSSHRGSGSVSPRLGYLKHSLKGALDSGPRIFLFSFRLNLSGDVLGKAAEEARLSTRARDQRLILRDFYQRDLSRSPPDSCFITFQRLISGDQFDPDLLCVGGPSKSDCLLRGASIQVPRGKKNSSVDQARRTYASVYCCGWGDQFSPRAEVLRHFRRVGWAGYLSVVDLHRDFWVGSWFASVCLVKGHCGKYVLLGPMAPLVRLRRLAGRDRSFKGRFCVRSSAARLFQANIR